MGKIVVPTKFNKVGKRVLTTPVEGKWVCAPADRRYRQSRRAIEAEFRSNIHKPWQAYIETMSRFLASYVGSNSASEEDRYRIIRFLAECKLTENADRPQLGDIPGLSQVEQEARKTYVNAFNKLLKKREEALKQASYEHDVEKRELWKEVEATLATRVIQRATRKIVEDSQVQG